MCGRYFIDLEDQNLREWLSDDMSSLTSGDVFPSHHALILTYDGDIKPTILPWGFTKWDNKKARIINARSETIMTSRFFKDTYHQNKAIVLASGFYEWGGAKVRHVIKPKDHSLLYMAGVIQNDHEGFAILTQPASYPVSQIHDRQPVMISKNNIHDYLTHQMPSSMVDYPSVKLSMMAIIEQASLFNL